MSEIDVLKAESELRRALLIQANGLLRSCSEIARRDGNCTNWAGIRERLDAALEMQALYLWRTPKSKPNYPKHGKNRITGDPCQFIKTGFCTCGLYPP